MENIKKYSTQIKNLAKEVGFSDCGISKAVFRSNEAGHLDNWLKNGMNAGMKYMENHFEKRTNPSKLFENAKSVISVILNYFPEKLQIDNTYKVSKYAYGEDYHGVLKNMLKLFITRINDEIIPLNGRAFVDSAPVLEKAHANYAGLGWIGKNSNLITKEFGSYVFVGELIVDIELEYDEEAENYCGNCTKCIDACPTKAIISAGVIDSRKCISYLTIEHKANIPEEFKGKMNDWIFGCDICQDVCPWNNKLKPNNINWFNSNSELLKMSKTDWESLTNEKFDIIFKESAIKRTKFEGLQRNIKFISDED